MGPATVEMLIVIGKLILYAIVGGVVMGVALAVFLRILQHLTPINEWEELKKGNVAVAIYFAASVLALGIVLAALLWPTERRVSSEPVEVKLVAPAQDLGLGK